MAAEIRSDVVAAASARDGGLGRCDLERRRDRGRAETRNDKTSKPWMLRCPLRCARSKRAKTSRLARQSNRPKRPRNLLRSLRHLRNSVEDKSLVDLFTKPGPWPSSSSSRLIRPGSAPNAPVGEGRAGGVLGAGHATGVDYAEVGYCYFGVPPMLIGRAKQGGVKWRHGRMMTFLRQITSASVFQLRIRSFLEVALRSLSLTL
jgi:hypothetical protein